MTTKSLLLGTIAGIAVIGAAQAADLPMTKGEAVEYVKVCTAFGPGFFYIPGTDTCLKIGGEIRADYRGFGGSGSGRVETTVNGGTPTVTRGNFKWGRNNDRTAFNTQARIWFDARTQTDWGLLRSYFQINADSHPISHQGRGGVYNGNTFTIDKAFIQFGGLTAGYAHSFFGFYDNEYGDTIWAPYYAESNTVNLLAYTAQFGGGFSATLSVEDGRDHRANIAVHQGGQQVPDVVGQLRWDQSWGSVAIQAAGHQFRSAEAVDANGVPLLATDPNYIPHKQKYRWAVGGTGLLKLPFIDGGHFIVEGQYADGALDYLGAATASSTTTATIISARTTPSVPARAGRSRANWAATSRPSSMPTSSPAISTFATMTCSASPAESRSTRSSPSPPTSPTRSSRVSPSAPRLPTPGRTSIWAPRPQARRVAKPPPPRSTTRPRPISGRPAFA